MKSLQPIAIPSDIPLAPSDILQVIRCTSSSETHFKSSQCGCNRAKLVCTMFCTCQNLTACYNKQISTSWIEQHRCELSALVVEALCQKLGKLYHNYPNDVWASSPFWSILRAFGIELVMYITHRFRYWVVAVFLKFCWQNEWLDDYCKPHKHDHWGLICITIMWWWNSP